VAGFSTKFASQWNNGVVSNMSPLPRSEGRHGPGGGWHGSAGWEDAAVIVPWELYRAYGDTGILAEHWASMSAWLGYVERAAADGRHPGRAARSAAPLAHEWYLWDTGFQFDEWKVPGEEITDMAAYQASDRGHISTAYFFRSALLASKIARVLGKSGAADRYAELAARVQDAWPREFIGADGAIRPDDQPTLVRALAFGLVPDELRARTAGRLVSLIREADTPAYGIPVDAIPAACARRP
jgi:alpha-L-rhamnosidase